MGRILSINDERVVCLRSPLPRARIPQTRWLLMLPQRSHDLSHITTIIGDGAGGALPILFESEVLFRYFHPCKYVCSMYI